MERNLCVATACILVFFSGRALAFKPYLHEDMCQDIIPDIERTVDGERLSFAEKTIMEIRKKNHETDSGNSYFNAAIEPTWHFDNELLQESSTRLIHLREDIISNITESSPNGRKARELLGTALHTLQDFYAHTNWIEIGNPFNINNRLGRLVVWNPKPGAAFCPGNREILSERGLKELTSGYFAGNGCFKIPDGKCNHGNKNIALLNADCGGIHKDEPTRTFYGYAYNLGKSATTDYLNQILDAPGVAGNTKAIKSLMGIKGTLGIVIDDTASMSDEINTVKQRVETLVGSEINPNKPDEFLLVRFGDPNVSPVYTTTNPSFFKSAINAIKPVGGGDCPEYSQSGLLQAIGASRNDSNIFLFTDASAKDAFLANTVSAAAQAKRIKIFSMLTGSCSPISPAYYQNANDTGGQVFVLTPYELNKVFDDLVSRQLSGDLITINRTQGTFGGSSKQLAAPVDSTITTVVFSATMDSKGSVTLMRPNGNLVQNGDEGVTIRELYKSTIITVNAPESGEWKLSSSGSGKFAMSAQANSPLDIHSFKFVELFAPAGAYRTVEGQPVVNTSPIVKSHLIGQYRSAEFRFIDEFGTTIEPVALAVGNPYAASDEFVGSVTLPNVPFRVAVSGMDASGEHYERLYPTLFRAQTVKVSLDSETKINKLPAGMTTKLRFKVENFSDSTDTFRMNAVDSKSFIKIATPTQLTLAPNASAFFEVDLHPSKNNPKDTDISITVTATSTRNSAITNSDTVVLTVPNSNMSMPWLFLLRKKQ